MIAGVDTGFFFALEEGHPAALKIWNECELVTSVIVLYELQKKILQGHFRKWPTILEDLKSSLLHVALNEDIALEAGRISYKYGLPGLDSLILASLLDTKVKRIFTTDAHFELYKEKGVEIINLAA